MKKSVIAMIVGAVALCCIGGTIIVLNIIDEKDNEEIRMNEIDLTKANAREFTIEELKKFDGSNGQPAYISVDGIVYDVSNQFINGEHHGMKAGQDLTTMFYDEHDKDKLKNQPIMGKLKGSDIQVATQEDIEKWKEEKNNLKMKEDEVDLQQDQLELAYKKGEIDYNAYQAKKTELKTQENDLEYRQDEIERKLEKAGYDD